MTKKIKKILLGPSSFGSLDRSPISKLEEHGFAVIDNPYKRKLTKEELLALLPGITGLIAGLETLDREVMTKSNLKIISRCGAGMSNVDQKAAKELGITVRNTPTAPVNAVAELTIGCLLSLLRQVNQMDAALHQKKWEKRIGRLLSEKNVAVIGYGNIGKKVGELLSAFGAKVLPVDPKYTKSVDLTDAIKAADIITLHCSGEACLLRAKEFGQMKQGIFILNAARGALIDEEALIHGLNSKQVIGAWLDTFAQEPYVGKLCDYPQVILTPHVGSYAFECRQNMEMETVNNLIDYFNTNG
ncbi:MAG: NAD(P)-dependent oxidoreductase [bacterium]